MSEYEKAIVTELERGGFVQWFISSGDSPLWARRTPEEEIARVVMVALEPILAARDTEIADTERSASIWRSTVEQLQERVAEQEAVIAKVRDYADDRDFHARGYLNTVNSGRIASDLRRIVAASPSVVLADRDADKWLEGAKAAYPIDPRPDWANAPDNPYRRPAVEED